MKRELWRDISGFEGLYQISNIGRVKSLSRKSSNGHNLEEKILSPGMSDKGYLTIKLRKDMKDISPSVHVLVAEAFVPNVNNTPYVNHKNGIRNDNNKNNLEWCTATENMLHAYKVLKRKTNSEWMTLHNPMQGKTGADCHNSKKVYQYAKSGEFIKEWGGVSEAERTLKIKHVSCVCLGKHRTAGGFQWSYEKKDKVNPYVLVAWNKKL